MVILILAGEYLRKSVVFILIILWMTDKAFGAVLRDSWRPMNGRVYGDCWNAGLR